MIFGDSHALHFVLLMHSNFCKLCVLITLASFPDHFSKLLSIARDDEVAYVRTSALNFFINKPAVALDVAMAVLLQDTEPEPK